MEIYDDANSSPTPNFAGVGVRRLMAHHGDEASASLSPVSLTASLKSPTRSEWFPDQIDQASTTSHSRLSCGRFPRFAKAIDNPTALRVATPTPILRQNKYTNHAMAPTHRPFTSQTERIASPVPSLPAVPPVVSAPASILHESHKIPARSIATSSLSSRRGLPTPELGGADGPMGSRPGTPAKFIAEGRRTPQTASTTRPGTPSSTRPKILVETYIRENGVYRGLHTPKSSEFGAGTPKSFEDTSRFDTFLSTSPKLDEVSSILPRKLSIEPNMQETEQVQGFESGPYMESYSTSSATEPRDVWDSPTTSHRSVTTPATSVDNRSSAKSDYSKHALSPDMSVPLSRPESPHLTMKQELRQSGLDAIDAFLWNTSVLYDASDDDESMDAPSRYSTLSYGVKPTKGALEPSMVPHSPIPEPTAVPNDALRSSKSLPSVPVQPLAKMLMPSRTVPPLAEPPSDESESDDEDGFTAEQWISSRLSTASSSTEVPSSDKLTAAPADPLECRRCHEVIQQIKIRCVDGKLSGVYHPDCFHCSSCPKNLRSEVFYVLDDQPYCYQHYHKKCNTFCAQCNQGIEGAYREADLRKYHTHCFTCGHIDSTGNLCGKQLDEYYSVGDRPFCENHARMVLKFAHQLAVPPRLDQPDLSHGNFSLHPMKRNSVLVHAPSGRTALASL
ncbi:hypothetical protein GLX27_001359 [Malassezia furfur]|uniref:LIM zinc-binding domain-containing protein n=1 Tax=Malassezia furfur TaxID=55194 RepID=A0ABY8EMD7_MALFU|nr:hypothetical protein GLX27_001359 [Malassezia furfur]